MPLRGGIPCVQRIPWFGVGMAGYVRVKAWFKTAMPLRGGIPCVQRIPWLVAGMAGYVRVKAWFKTAMPTGVKP
ncbi:MAG: hypothetical protein LDL12_05915 [Anaerolinea sp.]|nr:hypothetical protein [Anaerolinea sp.]